jgi:hypothetical protein
MLWKCYLGEAISVRVVLLQVRNALFLIQVLIFRINRAAIDVRNYFRFANFFFQKSFDILANIE